MLAQEAGQRSRRHRLEKAAGTLVAGRAGASKNLGRALAGLEILRPHRDRRETADQKHHRR
jgi:hypothetical protein